MKVNKLNIGSSSCHLTGWVNMEYDESYWKKHKFSGEKINELATRDMPDVFGDASNMSNLFPNETFDIIRSSHVLEHIPQNKTIKTLKEFYRILKPKGIARIIVPNSMFYIERLIKKEEYSEWWKTQQNDLGLYMESELKKPFGIPDDAFAHVMHLNGHHVTCFTPDLLKYYMELAGFVNIENCDIDEEGIPDVTVHECSLRLKGTAIK